MVHSTKWGQDSGRGEAPVITCLAGGPCLHSDLAKRKVAVDATVLRELLLVSGVEI